MQWALVLACILLWLTKLWLIPRLNINWDEFYFLDMVHAGTRGELTQGLQTAYTHLFSWLPGMQGDEIRQILVARALMVVLLGVSMLLIQRLATRWLSSGAAWTASLAFLVISPVLRHGGSFRADSLLLPLELGALVVLTSAMRDARSTGLGAGLLLGCATAVSVKAVLLAPVVGVLGLGSPSEWRRGLQRLLWLAAAASTTAAILLGAHLLSLAGSGAEAAGTTAQHALQKTIGDSSWFPQLPTLYAQLHEDRIFWLLAAAGFVWALRRRQWSVAACALSLLPVLFYRNSFSYFYVVMWGPACLTIAAACQALQELAARGTRPGLARIAAVALPALLLAQGLVRLPYLAIPRQDAQRDLVAAVHQIFPSPVPYIDHSGMIATFTKVNFFMSTWGVEQYLAAHQPFMPAALSQYRPVLLVTNRSVITPSTLAFSMLLAQDKQLIESYFQPYWGSIWVAGAAATLQPGLPVTLRFPFGGRYRLESRKPIRIDGLLQAAQSVITVSDDKPELRVEVDSRSGEAESIRLLWAQARPAPARPPPPPDYYEPL
jgi:hypothetical protein